MEVSAFSDTDNANVALTHPMKVVPSKMKVSKRLRAIEQSFNFYNVKTDPSKINNMFDETLKTKKNILLASVPTNPAVLPE